MRPRWLLLLAWILLLPVAAHAQPAPSAATSQTIRAKQLIITDGTGSVLQAPTMTTAQRDASTHVNGQIIHCSDCSPAGGYMYMAGTWTLVGGAGTGTDLGWSVVTTADSQSVIQGKINAQAATCGVVFFRDGDYPVNLTLPSCVTLAGSPRGLVAPPSPSESCAPGDTPLAPVRLRTASATGAAAVITVTSGSTNWAVRDMAICGHGSGTLDRGVYIPNTGTASKRGIIERVTFHNFGEEAVRVDNYAQEIILSSIKTLAVLKNTSRSVHSGGVDLSCIDCLVENSELNGPNAGALVSANQYVHALNLTAYSGNVSVRNTSMAFADAGLYVLGGGHQIEGSRFEYNWGHGVIVAAAGTAYFSQNVATNNSQETHNTYDGFYVAGSNNVLVGNSVRTVLGIAPGDPLHRYGFNDAYNGGTNVWIGNFVATGNVGTAKFNSVLIAEGVSWSSDPVFIQSDLALSGTARRLTIGDTNPAGVTPADVRLRMAGAGAVHASTLQARLLAGADSNYSYGAYLGVLNLGGTPNIVTVIGSREAAADWPALYTNLGQVGIGTSTPGYKLDVAGTLNVSGTVTFPGTLQTTGEVEVHPHGTGVGNAGELKLYELVANGMNYLSLAVPDALAASRKILLPAVVGTVGQSLVTDGGSPTETWSYATPPGTGTVTTSGALTATIIPKASGATEITNSLLTDDATTLTYAGTGGIISKGTAVGQIRLYELPANGTNYTGFSARDAIGATNPVWLLPLVDGTVGQVLTTDGAFGLSFSAAGTGTVTHTSTALTASVLVIGNGADDVKLYAGSGACAAGDAVNEISAAGVTTCFTPAGSGTVTGTGASGRVPFWTGASALSSDATFLWDNTNKRLALNVATPLAPLDIHSAPTTAATGSSAGIKVDVSDTPSNPNPVAADFTAIYSRIESSANRHRIWGFNSVTDIPTDLGGGGAAWGLEVDVNNSTGTDAPDPFNFRHVIGIEAASGGTKAASVAYASESTTSANRFKHGIWLKGIGGQTGSTLFKAGTDISVDFGLDLRAGTYLASAIALPNNISISARNAANNADINLASLSTGDRVLLGEYTMPTKASGIVNQVLTLNNTITGNLTWTTAAGGGTVTHTTGPFVTNRIVVAADNGGDVKVVDSLGTSTCVWHGNAGGPPTCGAVNLATDVSGDLPTTNPSGTSTFPVSATTGGILSKGAVTLTSLAAGTQSIVDHRGEVFLPSPYDASLKQPLRFLLSRGTNAAPDTTLGPLFGIYRQVNMPAGTTQSPTECNRGLDPLCSAGLNIVVRGTAANRVQPVGLNVHAQNDNTGGDTLGGESDSLGIAVAASLTAKSVTGFKQAVGIFIGARREDATGAGTGVIDKVSALEVQTGNFAAGPKNCFNDGNNEGSECTGVDVIASGAGGNPVGGIAYLARALAGNKWALGYTCAASGVSVACVDDISTATSSYRARGTYTVGIDLSAGTYASSFMKVAAPGSQRALCVAADGMVFVAEGTTC